MDFFAHTHESQAQPGAKWQLLSTHLRQVADLAKQSANRISEFDTKLAASAQMAGLLHDLGKYRPEFQKMLQGIPVQKEKTYHKQAGAAKACELRNYPVAFAIAGHHGGLANKADVEASIVSANGLPVANQVWPDACREIRELSSLIPSAPEQMDLLQADLLTRLIFSCLVDADWTDTGAHERQASGLPPEPPPAPFEADVWLDRLLQTLQSKAANCRETHVKEARRDVLSACLEAANLPSGVFSLTVPTGGGKTYASLAFALKHAAKHKLRRIIYVAPYLTILEQNETAMRSALGLPENSAALLAHHSLAEPITTTGSDAAGSDTASRRAENWDAPLIVTTNVQFFESLFSNKTSRCRKLQNIARSIIILDECQSLPPDLVAPTCGMLRQFATDWSTTIVLCTATQPSFDHEELAIAERLSATEIIPPSAALFQRLKRVDLVWPNPEDAPMEWSDIAQQMERVSESASKSQNISTAALAVVNSRRAARELFTDLRERFDEGVFHLSTSMCAAHRSTVLAEVRQRLRERRRCFLVSTQLIEAGVDLDFPVVFRELAPLEAIVQAAGRCNREGSLRTSAGLTHGKVIIFRSRAAVEEPRRYFPPDRWYLAGRSTLENHFLNAGRLPQIDSPADIHEYFTRLYHSGSLDKHNIQNSRRNFNFADVADKYQLIQQDGSSVIAATWEPHRNHVETLIRAVRRDPSRANFRALDHYQLNMRAYELQKYDTSMAPISEHVDQLVWYGPYDNELGLNPDAADSVLLV
ncbi:MAG: CRISPR-associated helicase Cas3' [Planctomyces sp.]|nr:CRISPR-associated helicase Cas3' [Planctomyces sp.]